MDKKARVIDGDGHIWEDEQGVIDHLEGKYEGIKLGSVFHPWPSLDGRYRIPPGGLAAPQTSAKIWGEFLDVTGIEQTVVYPTGGLAHGLIQDRLWAVALSRAYNNWLCETYIKADPRIKSMALLPVQDVGEAVVELRRGVEKLGLSGGLLPAVTYTRKPYGHPDFLPIIEEAERLNVPLAIHAGPQSHLGLEVFEKHIEAHVLTHPVPIMGHLISLVYNGVFERCPKVRMVFLEAGAGWVPFLMERMDYEYKARPGAAPDLKRLPSAAIRAGNVYVSCENEEKLLPVVADYLGADQIIFATDFPHELAYDGYLHEAQEFSRRADLGDALKSKIMAENSIRLYNLKH